MVAAENAMEQERAALQLRGLTSGCGATGQHSIALGEYEHDRPPTIGVCHAWRLRLAGVLHLDSVEELVQLVSEFRRVLVAVVRYRMRGGRVDEVIPLL